jgi:hypothetical protein
MANISYPSTAPAATTGGQGNSPVSGILNGSLLVFLSLFPPYRYLLSGLWSAARFSRLSPGAYLRNPEVIGAGYQ